MRASFKLRLLVGCLAVGLLPWLILFLSIDMAGYAYIVSLVASVLAHIAAACTIYSLSKYPGNKSVALVFINNIAYFLAAWVLAKFFELPYSLKFFAIAFGISVVINYWGFTVRAKRKQVLAFIPYGRAQNAHILPGVEWIRIDEPRLPEESIDGIVVDLHDKGLSDAWQLFLANQTLQGIPVYHIRSVEEFLTGRVRIQHMYENNLGSLLPSGVYQVVKYMLDVFLIVISLPLTLPVMLITAVLIKLESKGPIFFKQNRVGQGGKEFVIYKFRSMRIDSEKDGAKMAVVGDNRITKLGRFIRKVRIDELPQFFNIVKGEMSLIGPRPEQKIFVQQFEKEIAFYNYRHIVKPGVSGWAQVTQGYAANADETRVKLEYDLFYIKHFSFSLDAVIFFKTIKTIFTGSGAR